MSKPDRERMLDRTHPRLSVRRQCVLLSRSYQLGPPLIGCDKTHELLSRGLRRMTSGVLPGNKESSVIGLLDGKRMILVHITNPRTERAYVPPPKGHRIGWGR